VQHSPLSLRHLTTFEQFWHNELPSRAQLNGKAGGMSPEAPASLIPEIRISQHNEELASHTDESAAEGNEETKSSMTEPAPGVEKPPVTHLSEAHDSHSDEMAKQAGSGLIENEHEEDAAANHDADRSPASKPR
jgi:hypothetical protein